MIYSSELLLNLISHWTYVFPHIINGTTISLQVAKCLWRDYKMMKIPKITEIPTILFIYKLEDVNKKKLFSSLKKCNCICNYLKRPFLIANLSSVKFSLEQT